MHALSTGQILREPVATATWMTSRSNLGLGPQQFMFGGVTLLPACHLLGCRMNKKCPQHFRNPRSTPVGGFRGPDDGAAARMRELGDEAHGSRPVQVRGWFSTCRDTKGTEFAPWQNDPSAPAR
jgi:hypothetical protein